MASLNWIKIRDDLHEDPAVVRIASKMKIRPEAVVGFLVKFWAWMSRNTCDGIATGLTLDDVESLLAIPHFCHHMVDVGWLEFIESPNGCQIIIPNFDRHLSQGAKARALKARQKQKEREVSRNAVADMSPSGGDKNATAGTLDKRREDNS